jgi:NADH-quinone oxidoreductase subunit F
VAVVGGGNSAIDAARTALRLGAERVSLVYRRTRAEMPAWAEEVAEAEREGVRMEFLVAPLRIETLVRPDRDGAVTGIVCRRMSLGDFDASGRRRPVVGAAAEFTVPTDHVIAAIGQSIDVRALTGALDVAATRSGGSGYLKTDPLTGATSVPWLFAGGDAVSGPSSVVAAIAGGERAAVGIDLLLTGEGLAFWRAERPVDTAFDSEADPVSVPRAEQKVLPIGERSGCFDEVELPFSERVALREAHRCLRCDYRA